MLKMWVKGDSKKIEERRRRERIWSRMSAHVQIRCDQHLFQLSHTRTQEERPIKLNEA